MIADPGGKFDGRVGGGGGAVLRNYNIRRNHNIW